MLAGLSGKAGVRKLRLFAAACCRAAWPLLGDPRSREAVGVAELYADNRRATHQLALAREAAAAVIASLNMAQPARVNAARQAADCCNPDAWLAAARCSRSPPYSTPADTHAGLLRDVVPGPGGCGGRRAPPWPTRDVLSVARAAYRVRRPDGSLEPDALAALSDALEETGCRDMPLLFHLRGLVRDHAWAHYHPAVVADRAAYVPRRGPHVRGCWALDEVLGLAGLRG
jgi:hypothetical protein